MSAQTAAVAAGIEALMRGGPEWPAAQRVHDETARLGALARATRHALP